MAMRYYISTEEASFFTNNSMGYANSVPTTGTYKVGDFIISSTQEDGIFGWVCTVAGTPGEWEVIGSGFAGGGVAGSTRVVGYYNTVEFSDARTSIEIGIEGFDNNNDFLEVHYNGLLLAKDVHYSISEDGLSINAIGDVWNEDADDTQSMTFRVLKSEGMKIKKLSNTVSIDAACYEVEIGISGYVAKSDIIEVHLNGVLLVEGLDYSVEEGKLIKIDKTEAWNPYNVSGQKMYINVFKNLATVIEPEDGSVTLDKLSPEIAEDLGAINDIIDTLSIQNNSITNLTERITELEENAGEVDFSGIESKIGVMENLQTTEKGDLVGAINELFQSANNGKELIASAIGEPLSSEDTFSAMSEKINDISDNLNQTLIESNIRIADGAGLNTMVNVVNLHGMSENSSIKDIACGDDFTIVLKHDGTILATGNNSFGQLGLGDETNRTSFNSVDVSDVKQISAGCYHVAVVKNDGTLWGCGSHVFSELGTLEESTTETRFSTFTKMGITDVKQVLCADYSTLILKNDGTLWGCGRNINGVLGIGNTTEQSSFVSSGLTDVKEIFGSYRHVFALKNDGTLWACGLNDNGQLGIGSTTNTSTFVQVDIDDVAYVTCGYYHTVAVKNDGTIWACGDNVNYQLGLGDSTDRTTFTQVPIDNVYTVNCGGHNTLFLKYDGTVYGVGINVYGQLGTGDTTRVEQITQLSIDGVKRVRGGLSFTLVQKKDGVIWACGDNEYGGLGIGDESGENILVFTKCVLNEGTSDSATKFATGTFTLSTDVGGSYSGSTTQKTISFEPGFTPTVIFLKVPAALSGGYGYATNFYVSSEAETGISDEGSYEGWVTITDITSTSFTINVEYELQLYAGDYVWYAIG